MWQFNGSKRPEFAEEDKQGQESVWDYPRPPALETVSRHILVETDLFTIAETRTAIRILETASPPSYYLPPTSLKKNLVARLDKSFCEWKGIAYYLGLDDSSSKPIAWVYKDPTPDFSPIRDYVGFYPGRINCWLDGELVKPQPGLFYGGWLTDDLAGPFKGEPGTGWW